MPSPPIFSRRVSRHQALIAAGAATAAASAPIRRLPAQGTPVASPAASPAAATPAVAPWPMPSALAADASPLFRTVAEALVTTMEVAGVPGAAIGLLASDREEHATFGVESLSSLLPVAPETLFQIGSISKTFTATAIWRLIDEGALDLDAPVRTYITDLTLMDADVADRVAVRNLLDHTAGWYGDATVYTSEDDGGLAGFVAERLPQLPQLFPLGAFFSYNNVAFSLLGRLVEVATGTTYNAAMASLLFGPLGLDDTLLEQSAVQERPYADGHAALPINGQPTVAVQTPLWIPRSVDPAGGIWSTTRDMIRYTRFHMERGTAPGAANVVSPDSLAQMQEPAVEIPGTSLQMGMDWIVQDVDGVRAIFHSGDTHGQHADLVVVPGHGFALVVLTNGQSGGSVVAAAALDAALAGIPELAPLTGRIGLLPALLVAPDAPTVNLPPEQVAEYAGRYADPGQVMTLVQADDGLELSIELLTQPDAWLPAINAPLPPTAPVAFLEEDVAVANQLRLPFVRDSEGRVGWVSSGLRLVPRVDEDA